MTTLEKKVMASVGLIYTVRKLTNPFALQCYALVASIIGISTFVSVPNVAQNFLAVTNGGMTGVATFVVSAIVSTTLVVQVWLLVGGAALLSLFVRVARSFTTTRVATA